MAAKGKSPKSRSKKPAARFTLRRLIRHVAVWLPVLFLLLTLLGTWYADHTPAWLAQSALPRPLARLLLYFGDRTLMLTDAAGWTGHDAVYEIDTPAPEDAVFYAGAPRRTGAPAPADIQTLARGPFTVGWSDTLRHPVWVGYHVPAAARFEVGKRPSFRKDRAVTGAPSAAAYDRSGYDRGHLAPNHAIATRFGPDAQARTFLMSNIAPQAPALNRGPWRELERRIADLWTQRWGEIWVLCGTISPAPNQPRQTLGPSGVDVPEQYWMLIVAQENVDVRALALVLPQTTGWNDFPRHRIVTIDELEEMTGLDLLPELPDYLQRALEADRPTRLWPIRLRDIVRLVLLRFPGL